MRWLTDEILSLSPDIRYAAIYYLGKITTSSRLGTKGASSSESDKYEELIVNPTLLKLVTQRGDIDCGGLKYVLVRYGNFYQIIIPNTSGHISISLESGTDPLSLIEPIKKVIRDGEKK